MHITKLSKRVIQSSRQVELEDKEHKYSAAFFNTICEKVWILCYGWTKY